MSNLLPSILIVDDDVEYTKQFSVMLENLFDVFYAENIDNAQDVLDNEWIQVVLCSELILQKSANDFYKTLAEKFPEIVKFVIFDSIPHSLTNVAIKNYHSDQFICKSSAQIDIQNKLDTAVELFNLKRKNEQLTIELKLQPSSLKEAIEVRREALSSHFSWDTIVRSPNSNMNDICALIKQISPYDVNVLICGESGTGKELCARGLHYNSLRQQSPYIAENCGALPDELLESELFGHKKGAFTGAIENRVGLFESANGGTIFLDEIGETTPAFQLKLLRVLQEKEIRPLGMNEHKKIDVRIVAATNRDLAEDVRQGKFREDLYYRLTTFTVELPPLRERLEDLPYIAVNILNKAQIELGKKVDGFTNGAISALQKYQWPGNVRELENEIKRMLVISQQSKLSDDLISAHILQSSVDVNTATLAYLNNDHSLKNKIENLEVELIKKSLIKNKGNKTKVADELGLSRVGLRNKLERYNIPVTKQSTS